MNPFVGSILKQLLEAVGTAVIKALGQDSLAELAEAIADHKQKHEQETDPEEKRQLEKDIRFLESTLMLKIERKKLRLSIKIENALKAGIKAVLKAQFPGLF